METERLRLREWIPSDRKSFAELNSDPEVMEYFPNILSEEESNSFLDMIELRIKENGWGLWAVEVKSNNSFIGFVGLHSPTVNSLLALVLKLGGVWLESIGVMGMLLKLLMKH